MTSSSASAADSLNALVRQRSFILKTVLVCCFLGCVAYLMLPKRYKVSTVLSLEGQYFQIPMIADFANELYDAQELKARREALLQQALNHQFLYEIAERYGLLRKKANANIHSFELEELRKRFEIIPLGSSSFMINFIANDGQQGYQIINDFIVRLRTIMSESRYATLLNLHDAIEEQFNQNQSSLLLSARPEFVRHRAEKVREEINNLKRDYNDNHPTMAALKRQLADLTRSLKQGEKPDVELASYRQVSDGPYNNGEETMSKGMAPSVPLFDELLKKYRYLEIVIHLDQQNKSHYLNILNEPYVPPRPSSPKFEAMMAWSVALGFLLASIVVLMKELNQARPPQTLPVTLVRGTASGVNT